MNKKTPPNNRPFLDPEFLRHHFWQVSDPHNYMGFHTPFEKIRTRQGKTIEMAARAMKMDIVAYVEMEEGQVSARPEHIVAFCDAMQCTPMDLYKPIPGDDRPLPREIFHSMIMTIVQANDTDNPRILSIGHVLEREYYRAEKKVRNNLEKLKPLLMSMGYSPDLKDFSIPLSNKPVIDGDRRAHMEDCLNVYEVLLDTDAGDHLSILARVKNKSNHAKTMVHNIAATLFGADHADEAINNLIEALEETSNEQVFCDSFVSDPSVIGVSLSPDAPYEFDKKAKLLLRALDNYLSLSFKASAGSVAVNANRALSRLDNFKIWRNSYDTQMMLDWFENWDAIYQVKDGINRPPSGPKGFPLAPQ